MSDKQYFSNHNKKIGEAKTYNGPYCLHNDRQITYQQKHDNFRMRHTHTLTMQ